MAGSNRPINTAMTAITTNNSIKVNPRRFIRSPPFRHMGLANGLRGRSLDQSRLARVLSAAHHGRKVMNSDRATSARDILSAGSTSRAVHTASAYELYLFPARRASVPLRVLATGQVRNRLGGRCKRINDLVEEISRTLRIVAAAS